VILVTVGMQLGFDRLIEAMDALAAELGMPVVAQTGKGTYSPRHMEAHAKLAPAQFEKLVSECRLIVSHAGIGTVLTAARFSKPVVLLARRAALAEHRNDHQLATVANLKGRPGILVAESEADLRDVIAQGLAMKTVAHQNSKQADELNRSVAQFVETGRL